MKQVLAVVGIVVVLLAVVIGLSFAFGWVGVGYTSTVGKAQQNAERKVFEQSQSYVEGKRQEVIKYRYEYLKTKDKDERAAIRATLRSSLANFDKSKLDYDLQSFIDSTAY